MHYAQKKITRFWHGSREYQWIGMEIINYVSSRLLQIFLQRFPEILNFRKIYNSSCRVHYQLSLFNGHDCTVWFIICDCRYGHLSHDAIYHLYRLAAHWACPVWRWFNMDHNWWGTSKPGGQIVVSDTKVWLTVVADRQASFHLVITLIVIQTIGLLDWSHGETW